MCDELEKGSGGTSPSLNNARWWPLGGCPGCFLRLVPGEGSVRVQGKEKISCEYCKHITRFHILRNTKMNIVCGYNQEFRPKAMLKSWFQEDAHRVFLLLVLFGARLPVADKVVQGSILYERSKDEDEAHGHKEVHGCHIGDFWKRFPGNSTQRGHGQHSSDTCDEVRESKENKTLTLKHTLLHRAQVYL